MAMFPSVAGKNIYACCPCIDRKLNIMGVISNDKRTSKVNSKIPCCFLEEVGTGLYAMTARPSSMRADINCFQKYAMSSQV